MARVLGIPVGLGIAVLGALLIFTSGTAEPPRVTEARTLDPGGTCVSGACDVILDNVPPSITGGTDHGKCVVGKENEWHFIINGLGEGETAPASITVFFTGQGAVVIPIDDPNATNGHYTLVNLYLTDTVTGAEATIGGVNAHLWDGNFNLSHAPCLDVTSTPDPTTTSTPLPTTTSTPLPTATLPIATSTQQIESTPTTTATPMSTATPNPTSTPDPTGTPTATSTQPIATSTQQVQSSSTPTNTPVTQASNTPVPPTNTPVPTNTSVPLVAQVQSVQVTPPPVVRALPSTGNGGYEDNSMSVILGIALILTGSTISLAAMKRRA